MKTNIEMTRELGGFAPTTEFLERFAALVRADEKEACAKFFDDNDTNMFWGSQAAQHIRARGNT